MSVRGKPNANNENNVCRGGVPSPPGHGITAGVRKSRGLRAAGAARKGGTPGEGSPFNPLLRFVKHKRVPRAAARVQGLRPWTPPAFVSKSGANNF